MKKLNTTKFREDQHVLHNNCKLIKNIAEILLKDKGDINKLSLLTFRKIEQTLYNLCKIFSKDWICNNRDIQAGNVVFYIAMNFLPQLLKYSCNINVSITGNLWPIIRESREKLKVDKGNRTLLINTIWLEYFFIIRYILKLEDDYGESSRFKYILNLLGKESPEAYLITDLEKEKYRKDLEYDIKGVKDMERFNQLIYDWDYKAIYNVLTEIEIDKNRAFILELINNTVDCSTYENLGTYIKYLANSGNLQSEDIWTHDEIYSKISNMRFTYIRMVYSCCKLKLWEFLDNYKNSDSKKIIEIINEMFSFNDNFGTESKIKINEILIRRGGSKKFKLDDIQ